MERDTYKIDATDQILGRLASDVATHLMGKHKPSYVPHIDAGDIVIVSNIKQIKVTGKKMDQKIYYHHSFHPGGLKKKVMGKLFDQNPNKILELAVSRMLPKNKLRRDRLKRLQIS